MSVPKKNIVGARIRQARIRKKLTQDQLSAHLARSNIQLDRAGISKIETSIRCVYDYELKALAKALSMSASQLLGE